MGDPSIEGGKGGTRNEVAVSSDVGASLLPSCSSAVGLIGLPRDCLLRILSALSAPDVCRMARVCRLLRHLADSEEVWRSRLPSDPAIDPPSLPRKDLYFRLRAGMINKDLSQPYWLDPATGEGFFVKAARDLRIVWGYDTQYWKWEHRSGSWFAESACLWYVCWLEVMGEFEGMFLPGAYTVSFRMKLSESLFGWTRAPVKLSLSTSNGDYIESQRTLDGPMSSEVTNLASLRSFPSSSWMELDIGEFVVIEEMHVKLNFSMTEIVGGHWKRGLELDCVKIQPISAISTDIGRINRHFKGRRVDARMRNTHVD